MTEKPHLKDLAEKRILSVARRCFFEEGFQSFSMDELASELGMSKKTIYKKFPSKIALLEGILDEFKEEISHMVEHILEDPSLNFFQKLTKWPMTVMEKVSTIKPPFWRDVRRYAPESFKRIEEFREKFIPSHFESFIREGQEAGVISKELDARIVCHTLLAAVQRMMNPEFFGKVNLPPSEVGRQIFDILGRGMLVSGEREK